MGWGHSWQIFSSERGPAMGCLICIFVALRCLCNYDCRKFAPYYSRIREFSKFTIYISYLPGFGYRWPLSLNLSSSVGRRTFYAGQECLVRNSIIVRCELLNPHNGKYKNKD